MNHQRLLALEMCSMKATRQQNCNESPKVLGFRDVITEGYNAEKVVMHHNRLLALYMHLMNATRHHKCYESHSVVGFRDVLNEGYKAAHLQ